MVMRTTHRTGDHNQPEPPWGRHELATPPALERSQMSAAQLADNAAWDRAEASIDAADHADMFGDDDASSAEREREYFAGTVR